MLFLSGFEHCDIQLFIYFNILICMLWFLFLDFTYIAIGYLAVILRPVMALYILQNAEVSGDYHMIEWKLFKKPFNSELPIPVKIPNRTKYLVSIISRIFWNSLMHKNTLLIREFLKNVASFRRLLQIHMYIVTSQDWSDGENVFQCASFSILGHNLFHGIKITLCCLPTSVCKKEHEIWAECMRRFCWHPMLTHMDTRDISKKRQESFPEVGGIIRSKNEHIEVPMKAKYCYDRCSFCSEIATSMQECSRCSSVVYCSRKHQKRHWKEHRSICAQIASIRALSH